MRLRIFVAMVALVVVVGACGSDDDGGAATTAAPTTAAPTSTTAGTDTNRPMSIDAALEVPDGAQVSVVGPMIAAGDDVRLCGAVMESYPPQCGEPSLPLDGLDLDAVIGLSRPDPEFSGVVWTDYPLVVYGTMQGGILTEATPIQAAASVGDTTTELSLAVSPDPLPGQGGVVWLIDVTNLTETPLVLQFRDGQSADVVLTDESGTEVYRWSADKAFTDALWAQTIEPGATWSIQLRDELNVAPGRYLASATLAADNAPKVMLSLGVDVE
jgi:hypothetical protein